MRLLEFSIFKLWGVKTFSHKLHKNVNVLSGINGSGKTTTLDILYSILNGDPNNEVSSSKYEGAKLLFTDDFQIEVSTIENQKVAHYTRNGEEISEQLFNDNLRCAAVSTFDSFSYSDDYRAKIKERYSWVQSELDYGLANSLLDYYMYIVDLSKQIQIALDQDRTKIKQLKQYFNAVTDMQSICNDLFSPAIEWNKNSATVQFKLLQYEGKIIYPGSLSSGEKQMLIFLINTLVQKKEETIVFWDEPEISMHVDWQKCLIETMRRINPNMQLIIATHSPFIIFDGWENNVINMQEMVM